MYVKHGMISVHWNPKAPIQREYCRVRALGIPTNFQTKHGGFSPIYKQYSPLRWRRLVHPPN
eukprot:3214510-Prymnesium_polylepis.1